MATFAKNQQHSNMTLLEKYALEFAKVLLQDELRRAKDNEELEVCSEDFYYTACQAVNMADALAVAIAEHNPGWQYAFDEESWPETASEKAKNEQLKEAKKDIAACIRIANTQA